MLNKLLGCAYLPTQCSTEAKELSLPMNISTAVATSLKQITLGNIDFGSQLKIPV